MVWTFSAVLSGLAAVSVMLTAFLVHRFRNKQVMVYSQPHFLFMVLSGLLLMSAGSLVSSVQYPSPGSCAVRNWLIVLGYTLSVVPIVVKIAAINRLHAAAQRMRRINLDKRRLYSIVGYFCGAAVAFLTLRTSLDPATRQARLDLSERSTESGETIVSRSLSCNSESSVWQFVEIGWYCTLVLFASMLAFQNRDIRQEFNETSTLAFMCYSKLVFAILLLFTITLEESLNPQLLFGYQSLIHCLDALVSLVVYFCPKLHTAFTNATFTDSIRLRLSTLRQSQMNSLASVSNSKSRTPMSPDNTESGVAEHSLHTSNDPRVEDLAASQASVQEADDSVDERGTSEDLSHLKVPEEQSVREFWNH